MSHQQIKLFEGVYMTDFRKGASLKGLEATKNIPKDINLMMDDLHQLQNKTNKLIESISLIKEEEDWNKDNVYVESVYEDYGLILKYSDEMIETGRAVRELNYQPQKEEDAEVLDQKRVLERRSRVQGEFADFLKEHFKSEVAEEEKEEEGVFV